MHKGSHLIGEVFFALCKSIDTPRSLAAWMLYKYKEHQQLAELSSDSWAFDNADSFHMDYIVTSFLRKWKGLKVAVNRKDEALRRFATAEDDCRRTNERFRSYASGQADPGADVIHIARRKIARVLGPFSVSKCMKHVGWGPGATADLSRRHARIDNKLSETPSVTQLALPWARIWLNHDILWFESISGHSVGGQYTVLPSCFKVVDYNRVVTVDKTALVDRTIAAEPTFNGFFQKGVGRYIAGRLKSVCGIDLGNQEVNQSWASLAQELGLSTLDLSAASDSLALEVCRHMLPPDWFDYLYSLRSPFGLLPGGNKIRYEKMSSMGNGYTFELETLIFWATAEACAEMVDDWFGASVYGDDIIVSQQVSHRVATALSYIGFTLNAEKSFQGGRFFESCGKHYYDGSDVTPSYQKELVYEDTLSLIRLGNRIIRLAARSGQGVTLDFRFHSAWNAARRHAGKRTKGATIPLDLRDGDDGWCLPATLFTGSFTPGRGWRCRVLSTLACNKPGRQIALYANNVRLKHADTDLPLDPLQWGASPARADLVSLGNRVKVGKRWVTPQQEFWLTW